MCEGVEYLRPLRSGAGVEALHAAVRTRVPRLTGDRPPAPDIACIRQMLLERAFCGVAAGALAKLSRLCSARSIKGCGTLMPWRRPSRILAIAWAFQSGSRCSRFR